MPEERHAENGEDEELQEEQAGDRPQVGERGQEGLEQLA